MPCLTPGMAVHSDHNILCPFSIYDRARKQPIGEDVTQVTYPTHNTIDIPLHTCFLIMICHISMS